MADQPLLPEPPPAWQTNTYQGPAGAPEPDASDKVVDISLIVIVVIAIFAGIVGTRILHDEGVRARELAGWVTGVTAVGTAVFAVVCVGAEVL